MVNIINASVIIVAGVRYSTPVDHEPVYSASQLSAIDP